MSKKKYIDGLCFTTPLEKLRRTPNVSFDHIPTPDHGFVLDRVKHGVGAQSPSIKGDSSKKYWYMHPFQIDNLLVFHGRRLVELYSHKHNQIELFEITPQYIKHVNAKKIISDEPSIFGRYNNVFHRVSSPEGSESMNIAEHLDHFDIQTNFNIYELHKAEKNATVVRQGFLDQDGDQK